MADKKDPVIFVISPADKISEDISNLFSHMDEQVTEAMKKAGTEDVLNYILNLHATFLQVLNIMIARYLKAFHEAMSEVKKELGDENEDDI